MTLEERKAAAVKEAKELLKLYGEELEKITVELKQSGKYKMGLDANSAAYAPVNKKYDRLVAEIFKKYDLPPSTRIKMW